MQTHDGLSVTDPAAIPLDLLALPQWVPWFAYEHRDEKTGELKIIKKPASLSTFSSFKWHAPYAWGTFAACRLRINAFLEQKQREYRDSYSGGGLGFVFTEADAYCGIDLDRSIEDHAILPWAQELVAQFASYTERSCSGTGLHILIKGILPGTGAYQGGPDGHIQAWDRHHFFAMTGWAVDGPPSTIEPRQAQLEALLARYPPRNPTSGNSSPPGVPTWIRSPALSDDAVLQKCQTAKNAPKFCLLWDGRYQEAGLPTESEGDASLLELLAFYTQDREQLVRLFEMSSLCDQKWLTRPKYQDDTLTFILGKLSHTWQPGGSTGQALPWSDYTNGLAFVAEHGENLRYCYVWKKWLVWTGTHWEIDTSGAVLRLAKATVKQMAAQLGRLDEAQWKGYLRHIKESLSIGKLKAMVEMAQSEPGIAIQPDELDADPWLLNCQNGTLDLRSGMLTNHHKGDYLTKCLPTPYLPDASSSRWQIFLLQVMGGSDSLVTFLQRSIGYSLSGIIREHMLPILYGKGRNGKSTFLNTIRELLGPYAMKAGSELLLAAGYGDRHPTERADLAGKRFVCASETDEGRRLAEAFIKDMTGGEPLRVRRMHEDFWEFQPTHKTWLATNHKPTVKGTDIAVWSRLKLIPFEVQIAEADQDLQLGEKLLQELPGILAWAVEGCLAWQATGLQEPNEVREATKTYKEEEDILGAFIQACCQTGNVQYRGVASELYAAYAAWSEGSASLLGQTAFGKALRELGYESQQETTGKRRRYWVGIGLKPVEKPESEHA